MCPATMGRSLISLLWNVVCDLIHCFLVEMANEHMLKNRSFFIKKSQLKKHIFEFQYAHFFQNAFTISSNNHAK